MLVVHDHPLQLALQALGIEFLNQTQPGVRLKIPSERTRNCKAADYARGHLEDCEQFNSVDRRTGNP